jgi:hypothetical protein
MRRLALLLVPAVLLLVAVPSGAIAAKGTNVPPNFKRHENPYWVWYGPANWIDSYGQYDLIVSSPTGDDYLHYGASGTVCYPTPGKYFKWVRQYFKQTGGFYGKKLARSGYTKIGKIKHLPQSYYGPYGYRQQTKWKGVRSSGERIQGEITFDFFYVDAYDCGQAFSVRSAPANGFDQAIKTLRKIQKLIFHN